MGSGKQGNKYGGSTRPQKSNVVSATTKNTNAPIRNTEDGFTNPTLNTISKQISGVTDLIKNELLDNILNWNDETKKRIEKSDNEIQKRIEKSDDNTQDLIQQATNTILQRLPESIANSSKNFNDNLSNRLSSIANDTKTLKDTVNKICKSQKDINGRLEDRLSPIEKGVTDVRKNTEMLQSLPSKIDEITEILSSKGLQFKTELPTLNYDEETFAQMAEYGEKILQQLSIAARWYARKLPELEKHETTIKNLMDTNEKEKAHAKSNGEDIGRKKVIKELLELYGDTGESIHKLMEPEENVDKRLSILADFLKNQGVEMLYEPNQKLEITPDTRMKFEPYIANLGNFNEGKIIITAPAYTFDDKIFRASYKAAENTPPSTADTAPLTADTAPANNNAETSGNDTPADTVEPAREG